MRKASRAIIIEGDKLLVMFRNKYGSQYYTLVGGRVDDEETLEQALIREVREETGLVVTDATMVFVEEHPAPYNEQYIFLTQIAPHGDVAIQEYSEEGQMNHHEANIHTPMWVNTKHFDKLPFRSPGLQEAIVRALKKGFPKEPQKL